MIKRNEIRKYIKKKNPNITQIAPEFFEELEVFMRVQIRGALRNLGSKRKLTRYELPSWCREIINNIPRGRS